MPVETGTGAYVVNLGAVGVVGTLLVMPIEALILGAMAGAVAQGLNGAGTRTKGISMILVSMLLAGGGSEFMTEWLVNFFEISDNVTEQLLLRPLVPILIGAVWPWAVPRLADGLTRFWDGWIMKWVSKMGGDK